MENRFARLLHGSSRFVQQGTVQGRLYLIADYPGLVLSDQPSDLVRGDLYLLNDASEMWPVLDSYEGCGARDRPPREFRREIVVVTLDNGAAIPANAYLYGGHIHGLKRIESGDFLKA